MFSRRYFSFISACILLATGVLAAGVKTWDTPPFTVYPEETRLGDFMCKLWFWRGVPPCFKESPWYGAYVRYPTREKARLIVDTYLIDGLYPESLIVSFFGTLACGTYHPIPSVPTGDYWDSAFFALVKLDHRAEAKRMMMDIVFERGWAKGRFPKERYKALNVLSKEMIITLREYKPLVGYLQEEINKSDPDMNWINAIVRALSNFKEWNDELLPLFRRALEVAKPGTLETILNAFIDFEIPDESEFLLSKVLDGTISTFEDQKLCIRAGYVLDPEAGMEYLSRLLKKDDLDPRLKQYAENTLTRLEWYGKWEITDYKDTWDPGLTNEKILFQMKPTLYEKDDVFDVSMIMQISDPEEIHPIGSGENPETNSVSFEITPEELTLIIYHPEAHYQVTKKFLIKKGTGRNEGKVYLKFPLEGETDRKGRQKYGWIEIEKIS